MTGKMPIVHHTYVGVNQTVRVFESEYRAFAKENGLILLFSQEIKVGDLYLAKRNTGFHLLTAKKVDTQNHFILPVEEGAYPYDTIECVKVLAN